MRLTELRMNTGSYDRAPKDHINIMMLQTLGFGILVSPLHWALGPECKIVYVVLWAGV